MTTQSWTPVRRGNAYCSPACGGRCTYSAYTHAHERAGQLVDTLGLGWSPRVWENLGWHWSVYYRPKTDTTTGLTITPLTDQAGFFLSAHHPYGSFTTHGPDVNKLLAATRKHFALIARVAVAYARYFPGEPL